MIPAGPSSLRSASVVEVTPTPQKIAAAQRVSASRRDFLREGGWGVGAGRSKPVALDPGVTHAGAPSTAREGASGGTDKRLRLEGAP